MEERIEFYKNRTLSERFAATGDFVRQNWKVLLKNLTYIGVPLGLITGYFAQNYLKGIFSILNMYPAVNVPSNIGFSGCSLLLFLFIYAMTGSILNRYAAGSLTKDSGWADLKTIFWSIFRKMFLQGLFLFLIFAIGMVIIGIVSITSIAALGGGRIFGIVLAMFVVFAIFLALVPVLSFVFYPVLFENASPWGGIKKGFRLGFKYWASTFATVILGGLISVVVFYIIAMPWIISQMLHAFEAQILDYILSMLTWLILIVVQSVYIIFVGLQYTSIVEREEGVSLQGKVEEFDKL